VCDYSLHLVTSRPAKIADKLVTTKFNNSTTRGFAAIGEPSVAVCLRPGTEIVFENAVEYDNLLGALPRSKVHWNTAQFRQVCLDDPHAHHDALEFPDGQIVLLTRLCERQHATVLQLPAAPSAMDEAGERKKQSLIVQSGRVLLGSAT
jgi:hypothetical protein